MIWIIFIGIAVVSYIVQANLKNKFNRYSHEPLAGGLTGRDVAIKMLRDNGDKISAEDKKSLEDALATAKDTDKIALAPKLPLFSVPSKSIIVLSMSIWSSAS